MRREPMATIGCAAPVRRSCTGNCAMQERTLPRSGSGSVAHAAKRADARVLIEVMSTRRGCD
ncbi:hypothetical protein WJ16_20125 [Burkholderia metallica]|nr:hypothetical protein WJ16_20125 [Burkholderia metallica]